MDTSLFERAWNPARTVVLQASLASSVDNIWEALTTSAGWKRLMDVESRVELRIGGPYEILFDDGQAPGLRGSEGCEVLSFIPQKMLSVSWNAPPEFPIERARRTWVVVELSAYEGTTRLTLTHLGFADHGQWPEVQAYYVRAWGMVVQALQKTFGKA